MEGKEKKRTTRKFTSEEDRALRKLVKEYGEYSWDEIAANMNGRNARQCHDRWTYYLSPKINHAPWTDEDDKALIQAYTELNGKWVQIAKRFKGRTDTQIKNRWNTLNKIMYLPKINKNKTDNKHNKEISNQKSSSEEAEENQTTENQEKDPQNMVSKVVDKFISLFNDSNMVSDWPLDFFQ